MTSVKDRSNHWDAWLSDKIAGAIEKSNIAVAELQRYSESWTKSGSNDDTHKIAIIGQCILHVMEPDIERAFHQKGIKNIDVINFSAPGGSVKQALNGSQELVNAIRRNNVDTVLIFKGGIDLLNGRPIPDIKNDLDQFITTIKKTGAQVALIGVKHEDLRKMAELKGYPESYIKSAESMFIEMAQKHNISLYPSFFAGLNPGDYLNLLKDYTELAKWNGNAYRLGIDGMFEATYAVHDLAYGYEELHSNREGQRKIATKIANFVEVEFLDTQPPKIAPNTNLKESKKTLFNVAGRDQAHR